MNHFGRAVPALLRRMPTLISRNVNTKEIVNLPIDQMRVPSYRHKNTLLSWFEQIKFLPSTSIIPKTEPKFSPNEFLESVLLKSNINYATHIIFLQSWIRQLWSPITNWKARTLSKQLDMPVYTSYVWRTAFFDSIGCPSDDRVIVLFTNKIGDIKYVTSGEMPYIGEQTLCREHIRDNRAMAQGLNDILGSIKTEKITS